MATRGSIPRMMELAGIDMLPPEAGIPLIRRELTAGGTRGEIVIGHRLGALLNEWDATGGLDTSAVETSLEKRSSGRGPMLGRVVAVGIHGLTIETTLDPTAQPFLHDHQIADTAVLPGVMGIEAFAEAAACLIPDWAVESVEEVNFLAPFKFYRNEARTLSVEAMVHSHEGAVVADCRLIGRRNVPNQTEPQATTHFTARVRMTKQPPATETSLPLGTPAGCIVDAADIYRLYFHGPAYQVVERAWWDGNRIVGLMKESLPVNHYPPEQRVLMAPRLIELCFQAAGLWEMGVQGRMGLPRHIERVSLLRAPELANGCLYAVVTPHPDRGDFDAEVVDTEGNRYLRLRGYHTVALPDGVNAEPLKALQDAMSLQAVAA